jgi:APA family basic amino acid/polyamine antiporter
VYTEWIFFALMALGLLLLRSRPGYRPRYRVSGFPLVPALFIVSALVIVIRQVWSSPIASGTGLGLVALGWPVYRWWERNRTRERERARH